MVSLLASHLPGLPWEETVSFYLCPTIACLVCHRLNTSPVYIPMASLLASHLPGLPWEDTVSFYLCPTIACLVCHRPNTSHVYMPMVSLLASHQYHGAKTVRITGNSENENDPIPYAQRQIGRTIQQDPTRNVSHVRVAANMTIGMIYCHS